MCSKIVLFAALAACCGSDVPPSCVYVPVRCVVFVVTSRALRWPRCVFLLAHSSLSQQKSDSLLYQQKSAGLWSSVPWSSRLSHSLLSQRKSDSLLSQQSSAALGSYVPWSFRLPHSSLSQRTSDSLLSKQKSLALWSSVPGSSFIPTHRSPNDRVTLCYPNKRVPPFGLLCRGHLPPPTLRSLNKRVTLCFPNKRVPTLGLLSPASSGGLSFAAFSLGPGASPSLA